MVRKKQIVACSLALILALGGGVQYYHSRTWGLLITGLMLIWAGYWLYRRTFPAGFVILAVLCSALANLDIWSVSVGRLLLYLAAAGALAWPVTPAIWPGFSLAGLVWPLLAAIGLCTGLWAGNANIMAACTLIFLMLVIIQPDHRLKIAKIATLAGLLLWLGSRGALLGLAVGLLAWLWPAASQQRRSVLILSLPLLAGLVITWRPNTALYRLHYWQNVLDAWWSGHIWFGLGPGGLWVRQAISEPGGGWQLHAHNLAVTNLVELGLIGVTIIAVGFWLYRDSLKINHSQLVILSALLAHALVDDPFWWPGPLLLLALVIKNTPPKIVIPSKNMIPTV